MLVVAMVLVLSISCLTLAQSPPSIGPGFKVMTYAPNLYCLFNRYTNSYLLVGKKAAVLIDTGFGDVDYYEVCESITRLPLSVVVTHGHMDHAGGLYQFPQKWRKRLKVGETNVFGDIKLEVIATPGHTPSSVCLFDRENGRLFTGDTINPREIWLHLPESNLEQWLDSIDKLMTLYPDVKTVLPGHGPPYSRAILREAHDMANGIRSGEAQLKPGRRYESTSFVISVQ